MNQKKAKQFRAEAIALASNIIAQSKGELSGARHLTCEAHEWLQTIDPSYKPEAPKAAPVQRCKCEFSVSTEVEGLQICTTCDGVVPGVTVGAVIAQRSEDHTWAAEQEAKATQQIVSLGAALTERTAERDEQRKQYLVAEQACEMLTKERDEALDLAQRRFDIMEDGGREHAKIKAELADVRKQLAAAKAQMPGVAPVAAVRPTAAQMVANVPKPAPVASNGPVRPAGVTADSWEAMTPTMRDWCAKRAPQASNLDID